MTRTWHFSHDLGAREMTVCLQAVDLYLRRSCAVLRGEPMTGAVGWTWLQDGLEIQMVACAGNLMVQVEGKETAAHPLVPEILLTLGRTLHGFPLGRERPERSGNHRANRTAANAPLTVV